MRFDIRAGFGRRHGLIAGSSLALIMFILTLAAPAFADGGSVRYSYELIELPGGDQWGLVPVAERKELSGKLSKSKLFDAFNLLKDDKKSTYGHSSIKITGRLPDRADISVKIDAAKAAKGFAPIIMAETVYTLSELGVTSGVEFPGHYDGKMKREDVPFYAYTLTLPLWRALPEQELAGAQVRLPDGELIAASQFYRRWKANDPELQKAFFSYLQDSQAFTVVHVLGLLPKLGLDYRAKVIPLLSADSATVRKHALKTLEAHRENPAVLAAVQKMMKSDKSATLARAAAEFLGKSKSAEYSIQKPLYLLEKGTEAESVKAAQALGKRNSEKATAALVAHLVDKRAPVAAASAAALEVLEADARQIEALSNKKIAADLRLTIAEELAGDDDDASSIVGLSYVANNTSGRTAELAIRKLGAIDGDSARQAIEEFLDADESRKRLSSAEVLVERGDIQAMPALADAIDKGADAAKLEALAYKLMVAQPLATILEQSNSRNKITKKLAYQALGVRAVKEGGGAEVFDKLARGAESSDPAIRGASAAALGAFASDEALAILKKLADDKNANVRAGVAHGLSNYKNGELFDTLAKYLEDPAPVVVAAALDAMAARKEAAKWDKIKDLSEAKDPRVRSSALAALGSLVSREDKKGVNTVISLLSGAVSDESRQVQLTALEQLATLEDRKATTGIAILLNAQDPALRVAAIEALGKTGHASATELVLSVLEDPNADIRRAAIEALGNLKAKSAQAKLQALLKTEKDSDLKKLIKQTLSQI
jgi:HEAT repeat protein